MMNQDFFEESSIAFANRLAEIWRDAAHSGQLLSKIAKVTYDHGVEAIHTNADGLEKPTELEELGGVFELEHETMESGDVESFKRVIAKGVEDLRRQILSHMFDRLREAADSVGNVVDMGGKPLTGRALCDMVEMTHFEFDRNGNAKMPTLVVSPEMRETVERLLDEPDVQLRLDVIIRAKWLRKYSLKVS